MLIYCKARFGKRINYCKVISLAVASLLSSCASQPPDEPTPTRPIVGYRPDIRHGAKIYAAYCGSCHNSGNKGAPQLDDAEEWDERAEAWPADIEKHVRQGFLSMPPKGGSPNLSDADIADAIHYILGQVAEND